MSEFQIGERIGEGQGEEFKAIAPNGMTVALKKVPPSTELRRRGTGGYSYSVS
jgi:hypothetical protein